MCEVVVDNDGEWSRLSLTMLLSTMQAVNTERARVLLYGVKMEQEGGSKKCRCAVTEVSSVLVCDVRDDIKCGPGQTC